MSTLLADARRQSGLTLMELAARAGTSHSTLSAYEHGRKQPQLSTLERIFEVLGLELSYQQAPHYDWHQPRRGAPFAVPRALPRLSIANALAFISLPVSIEWSGAAKTYDMRNRADRARVYELVLREGTPDDIEAYVDGALLVDVWDDLVLPAYIRKEWQPVIDAELRGPLGPWHGSGR